MGLFDSLLGKQKTQVPASGFYATPQPYQDLFNNVVGNVNSGLGSITPDMFSGASGATAGPLSDIMKGFTPTSESLGADINMLMNPYNESVIGEINRQATGQNSLVKQAANQAGQMGSNRSFLGTSDVEQNRLNNIGQFQQGQYNTALSQVLNNLVPGRRADAAMAYETGMGEKQAPLQALMAQMGLLQGTPTMEGTQAQTVKTGGGIGGLLSGASSIASLASMFSDARMKENIVHIGEENGFPIYEFNYISQPGRKFVGVMAQDVEKVRPDAVINDGLWKKVDYAKIGVEMREVL